MLNKILLTIKKTLTFLGSGSSLVIVMSKIKYERKWSLITGWCRV